MWCREARDAAGAGDEVKATQRSKAIDNASNSNSNSGDVYTRR